MFYYGKILGYNPVPPTIQINTTSPLQGGGNLSVSRTLSILDAKADSSTKGAAAFSSTDFNDNGSGLISLKVMPTPTSREIATTSPLQGGGDLSANRTLSIDNAKADGSTKGAAAFSSTDFVDNGSGLISFKNPTIVIATTGVNQTTTSNTAVNIVGFSATLKANKRYQVVGQIRAGCNNTGGVRFGATAPSGATFLLGLNGISTSATAFSQQTTSGALSTALITANTNAFIFVCGTISVSSTAGVFQIQFASGVAGQTSTFFVTNSSLFLYELL